MNLQHCSTIAIIFLLQLNVSQSCLTSVVTGWVVQKDRPSAAAVQQISSAAHAHVPSDETCPPSVTVTDIISMYSVRHSRVEQLLEIPCWIQADGRPCTYALSVEIIKGFEIMLWETSSIQGPKTELNVYCNSSITLHTQWWFWWFQIMVKNYLFIDPSSPNHFIRCRKIVVVDGISWLSISCYVVDIWTIEVEKLSRIVPKLDAFWCQFFFFGGGPRNSVT